MSRDVRQTGLGLFVVASFAAGVAYSDDDSEPLYVWQDGRRVPTVIVAPQAGTPAVDGENRTGWKPVPQPAQMPQPDGPVRVIQLQDAQTGQGKPRPADQRPGFNDADGAELDAENQGQALRDKTQSNRGATRAPYSRVYPRDGGDGRGSYAGYPISFTRRYRGDYPPYYGYGALGAQVALEDAYYAGRQDEREDVRRRFNLNDMNRRAERALSAHEKALRLGQQQLRGGEYARAISALTMAAELNHGDPVCRLHLAQARMARGHYEDAAKDLRRALQLQPKLIYVDLHLGSYYPTSEVWDEQTKTLAAYVERQGRGTSADVAFLLGFCEYQRGRFDQAHRAFARAGREEDLLTREYLKLTKPAAK